MSTLVSAPTPEAVLQRLDWQVVRRLDGLLQGDYRSLFYGHGLDFADLRAYQPEDDIRHIDWNVTARMNAPYVRQYVEDREITGWFLLDLSPSMDFGAAQSLKRTVLIDLATTLARVLTRGGNRVGALLYGSRVERTIPPRGGRTQVLRLVNELLRQPQLPRAPFTNLAPLLEAGLHTIRKRSLIVIVSDFIGSPGWERPLRQLRRRHEVVAVRLWDPREGNCRTSARSSWKTPRRASSSTSTRATGNSASASTRRRGGAKRRCTSPSNAPGSTPCRSRPRTTWSA